MDYATAIPGFAGYAITANGAVFCGNRLLKPSQSPGRAARVKLRNSDGAIIRVAVAKLIAITFISNPENHAKIIFKDRNKSNCTPSTARTPLDDNDNSSAANNARAGVISVLSGKADPTGGAVLWDGSDFLKNGTDHNKFKEYSGVTISATDLQTYSSAQKVKAASTFKTAIDDKTSYTGTGKTGKTYSLQSTGAQGKSIFWKIIKN